MQVENLNVCGKRLDPNSSIIEKIEQVFAQVFISLCNSQPLYFEYVNRENWENAYYIPDFGVSLNCLTGRRSKIKFACWRSVRRFSLILHFLSKIRELLERDVICTKRELYYLDVVLYGSQDVVDDIIDDIACMLSVSRRMLHIVSTAKGCIAGSLSYVDADGSYCDCSKTKSGFLIPFDVLKISHIRSDAMFVLVIEKEAIFQSILDSNTDDWPPIILITGKGFPDLNTREVIKLLSEQLTVPVLALVDADPFGLEIFFNYRYGSLASSYDCKSLAVPHLKLLGLLPTDVNQLQIPDAQLIPMLDLDRKKLEHFLKRPYLADRNSSEVRALIHQISCLQIMNKKAEIESLAALSPNFLSSSYIPTKLAKKSWI